SRVQSASVFIPAAAVSSHAAPVHAALQSRPPLRPPMKLLLCLIPGLLIAQSDWTVPPEFAAKGYRKEATAEGVLLTGPGPAGALTRTIDAAPFRGQRVRLRAAIRGRGAHLQL